MKSRAEGRCHVIENWMRLRGNPLLQSCRDDDFAPRLQGRGISAYRFGGTMPNDTSSDQETIEATIAPFYHAIGRATKITLPMGKVRSLQRHDLLTPLA